MIKIGFSVNEFWDLTLDEMYLYINNYTEELKQKQEEDIYLSYQTASLTAAFVNNSMSGQNIPSFYELFPMYQTQEYIEEQRRKQIEIYKAQFMAFAQNNNKKFS